MNAMKTSNVQRPTPNFQSRRRPRTSARFIGRWMLGVGRWTFCLALAAAAHAGPRTSANYSIATDMADSGGNRATSAAYTNDASLGGIAGTSTVASPIETAKAGYIAQLFDITGFAINAASPSVNEEASVQLGGFQMLDDGTFLTVPATSVGWSGAGGVITSISASGLATAAIVYQDTPVTVRGSYLGQNALLGLTVRNVNNDDFGAYAGDGIDDAWQVQYFGQPPNANAGPNVDFDHTGQTNLFKYVAGLNPLDPASHFDLIIAPVPGQPSQRNLIFTPIVAGRTYVVKFRTDLTLSAWTTLTGTTQADLGAQRTVTDTAATGVQKFYRIEITKP